MGRNGGKLTAEEQRATWRDHSEQFCTLTVVVVGGNYALVKSQNAKTKLNSVFCVIVILKYYKCHSGDKHKKKLHTDHVLNDIVNTVVTILFFFLIFFF